MFGRRSRVPTQPALVDGKVVGRALREQVRPLLKAAGFTQFSDRRAWRQSECTIDHVTFRSLSSYIADGVGCTTHSFTAEVGVFYMCFDPEMERPKEYELTFRAVLGKTLRQPLFQPHGRREAADRPDVWYVTPDGKNLDDCVRDAAACLEDQALPFLEAYSDPNRAFHALLSERSSSSSFGRLGITMPGSPGSPHWHKMSLGIGHLILDDPGAAIL